MYPIIIDSTVKEKSEEEQRQKWLQLAVKKDCVQVVWYSTQS